MSLERAAAQANIVAIGRRQSRVARGSSVGSFATFVALAGHVLAGGGVPSYTAIALALAGSCLLGILVAGDRLTLGRLSIGAAAAQLIYHYVFSLNAHRDTGVPAGHHMVPTALPETGGAVHPDMTVMHLIAATLTILYVTLGQRFVAYALRAGLRRLRRILTVPIPVNSARPSAPRPEHTEQQWQSSTISRWFLRRGPPSAFVIAHP
ncbi:hypothetical protein ACFSBZ_17075 [Amnibacterium flavum]|uniref:Uncharacterized protein n=1 Tax=Amnibacterium flavum TaxID=2173173 RepID=A0A2V1HKR1_9MICO|nr:hypothetical protein [Amnibacterium flavum]PVZ93203.1 hypothetical protein DDQ50_16930 [Amnibacterium flavum]